jgi:hypothetical protein
VEKENVGVSDDVSEIGGPRHSSAGPDPPETQQTVRPLPSRQPPVPKRSPLLPPTLAACTPRRLSLNALHAPSLRLVTRGCTSVFRVSRMDARRRLAAGQHARALLGRGTAQ